MRIALILTFLLLNTVSSYSQHIVTTYNASRYSKVIIGDNFKGAVFDKAFSSKYLSQQLKRNAKKRFTPSDLEILHTEHILQHFLNDEKNKSLNLQAIYKFLNITRRQYFGYINNKGQKVIFINCFRYDKREDIGPSKDEWFQDYRFTFDGGCGIWRMAINLHDNAVSGPECNNRF
ncbi:hypothetical protein [Mucilaginibacter ginkgonis]|uniref:Uncharacterized protein n=1 Tax=Mucilaginibacter ginkgonis TaxID=2682091 RepID=A0A6I4HXH5_9SPHI|nr:hypothetical protein [Mucilaginibacter ginkgonis]QQL51049.1 hypothetical protein GO620_006255 [Mucilaginibacter ginkgonis]